MLLLVWSAAAVSLLPPSTTRGWCLPCCWGFQTDRRISSTPMLPSKARFLLSRKRPFSGSPHFSAGSSASSSHVIAAEQKTTSRSADCSQEHDNDANENAALVAQQLPYAVARGDGSTGGGGLPMPDRLRRNEKDDEHGGLLRRPKVGAEMPKGRPSWFHVPAPSQGTSSWGSCRVQLLQ
jgi:hypothetical protein